MLRCKLKKNVARITGLKYGTSLYLGTHVTGSQLACMLQTYVNAVNEPGAIPVVETSWETSLRILAERFYQEAVEIYKKGMTAGLDACGEEPMEADGGTLQLPSYLIPGPKFSCRPVVV